MKLSASARVGGVTLLALVLLGVSMSWLSHFSLRPKGYVLKAVFSDVDGLLPGATVMLMGVKVGRVLGVFPHERTVSVDLEISDPSTRIFRDAQFKILTKGIIGEKSLEIFPPESATASTFLAPGSLVYGDPPARLGTAMEQASKALLALRDLANSPETRGALKGGIKSFEATFKDLGALIKHTDEVAVSAQTFVDSADGLAGAIRPGDLSGIVSDLRTLTRGLRHAYQSLAGQGDQMADARETLSNLRSLTARLESIAGEAEKLATDPKLQGDVKDLISTSRRVANTVSEVAATPPRLSPRFDLLAVQETSRSYINGNFNLGLRLKEDSFYGGIDEIGGLNLWNLWWGKPDFIANGLGFHLGMVRNKIGAGLDWAPAPSFDLTTEVYDPLNPGFRLSFEVYPSWWHHKIGLTGAWIRSLNAAPQGDRLFLGGQWRPLD